MKKKTVQRNAIQEAIEALDEIVRVKGIDREEILKAFETALISACKKDNKGVNNVRSSIDRVTYEIELAIQKEVVEEVTDSANQVSLEDARAISHAYEIGDIVEFPVDPTAMGRVATQNAKQYVLQQLKECERQIIFDEYINKKDEIMVGIIQRTDKNNIYVDLGKVEGVMNLQNQVPTEQYLYAMRVKVYVVDVIRTNKGTQIYVSRTHAGLIKRLFEMEIPEIFDGTVQIKSIVREAGSRTKIAVYSENPDVDAVGACVGQKGIRIQNILNEIGNEKIDVIEYSEDPMVYIANAISPAEAISIIVDEEQHMAVAIVDDSQLSLAIGKDGQNVRLAARLTGWKIDIKTPRQYEEMKEVNENSELQAANAIFAGLYEEGEKEEEVIAEGRILDFEDSEIEDSEIEDAQITEIE